MAHRRLWEKIAHIGRGGARPIWGWTDSAHHKREPCASAGAFHSRKVHGARLALQKGIDHLEGAEVLRTTGVWQQLMGLKDARIAEGGHWLFLGQGRTRSVRAYCVPDCFFLDWSLALGLAGPVCRHFLPIQLLMVNKLSSRAEVAPSISSASTGHSRAEQMQGGGLC